MKAFEIQVDKSFDVYFRLKVYPSRRAMHAAIKKDDEIIPGGKGGVSKDTIGMFRSTCGVVNHNIPGICRSNILGIMYVNLADLSNEVIAHECAHAAFFWEHDFRRYTGKFDEDEMEEQEAFCYFVGKAVKIVREIIRKNFNTGDRI